MKNKISLILGVSLIHVSLFSKVLSAEPSKIFNIRRLEAKIIRDTDGGDVSGGGSKIGGKFSDRMFAALDYLRVLKQSELDVDLIEQEFIHTEIIPVDEFVDPDTKEKLSDDLQALQAYSFLKTETRPAVMQIKKEFWKEEVSEISRNNELFIHEGTRIIKDYRNLDSGYALSRKKFQLHKWNGELAAETSALDAKIDGAKKSTTYYAKDLLYRGLYLIASRPTEISSVDSNFLEWIENHRANDLCQVLKHKSAVFKKAESWHALMKKAGADPENDKKLEKRMALVTYSGGNSKDSPVEILNFEDPYRFIYPRVFTLLTCAD
jgi:hypothetical protein